MKINGNEIRPGMMIEYQNSLWVAVKTMAVKPGKGPAYNQVELKNIIDGRKLNNRFASDEKVENARVERKDFQFLYKQDNNLVFMDTDTYEQIELNTEFVGDRAAFLQDGMKVTLEMYEDRPVGIKLPDNVVLKIIEADAVVKGQTASSSYKPAKLENGLRILVPPFIAVGEKVVVDTNEAKLERYSAEGWLTLVGDATLAKVLHDAQIERARGLVAATTTDAINIYIILTARSLNPQLKIIARASEEDAEKHLLTAGADSVVSPYSFAGYRIAQTFMRPNVVDFFDTAMNQKRPLEIEEVKVGNGARVAGQTLEGSRIRQEMGVIVLAIKGESTAMRFNPPPDEVIHAGDHLIAMGDPEGLRRLEESSAEPA